MGVAGEIGEYGLGSGEGALGVDDPFELAQGGEIRREGLGVDKSGVSAEEAQAGGVVGRNQLLQEQAAEQP